MSFHSDIKPMIKALKKIRGWKRSVALDHMEIWLKTIDDRRTLRLYFLRDVESHALTFYRFRRNGQAQAADSWVKTGPNQPLGPDQLEQAIGPDVLNTLSQHTGREE